MEGTLHMREPKKGWKQSHLSLKNGYLSVNKERGVSSNSQFVVVKTVLIDWVTTLICYCRNHFIAYHSLDYFCSYENNENLANFNGNEKALREVGLGHLH